jgi:hypothetical protein
MASAGVWCSAYLKSAGRLGANADPPFFCAALATDHGTIGWPA